jgi:competence protein ComEA
MAQRIIDYRTQNGKFTSADDLRNVRGIGEKRFGEIEPFVRVD